MQAWPKMETRQVAHTKHTHVQILKTNKICDRGKMEIKKIIRNILEFYLIKFDCSSSGEYIYYIYGKHKTFYLKIINYLKGEFLSKV